MSVESMAIALHHSKASGTAKLVLIGIANHDGDGGAWPSQRTLAKYANVTRSRVKAATDKLIELGEIAIEANAGGSRNAPEWERPHLYRLTLRCPDSCDRSTQHRDRRKHYLDLPPVSSPIPPGGIDIPPQVSAGYSPQVLDTPQEPPPNYKPLTKKANHSTREGCGKSPNGEHNWEPSGWCVYGEHRRLEAVSA